MSIIESKYNQKKDTPSDINEHLETLYTYGSKCDTIAEFGVFQVTSTYAFAATRPQKLICVDINSNDNITTFLEECKLDNINVTFVQASTIDYTLETVDLLFIDTLHTYNQLTKELERHHDKVKKYLIFHDTESYGISDEINYTGLVADSDNGKRGLNLAISEFLQKNQNWKIAEVFTNNNGLTVIKNTLNIE
jgi:hypothetical protein